MQKGSSEGVSLSPATQKISCDLRRPKYQYRSYEGLPLFLILSQLIQVLSSHLTSVILILMLRFPLLPQQQSNIYY